MEKFLFNSLLLSFLLTTLSACSTITYYSQSIHGHFQVMNNSRDIETILSEDNIDLETRDKLTLVLQLLQFAKDQLKLPENGSYRQYSDIGRPYVVWNVFAAPEFSLEPVKSCFFFVGCLNYRGYFSEKRARRYAANLEAQSLDVFLGGVAAYSTLGWFKDPLLNTMLKWDETYLGKVVFHELAHQKFYIEDDSAFNEAFSDTVANIGLERWLRHENKKNIVQEKKKQQYEKEFVGLVLAYKSRLLTLYQSSLNNENKRMQKRLLMMQMDQDYRQLKKNWDGYSAFDNWFSETPNNAKIAAISTYREFIPGFLKLYQESDNNLERFYSRVKELSLCKPEKRNAILRNRQTKWSC